MLEITEDDVSLLNDDQLRAVVARLCEADLRQRGYSSSCVTAGGDQNAPDGGIDVRVALPAGLSIDGFVPRPATGFQVKAQDMPAGAITAEMRPTGVLRPAIQALAEQRGAYVIVSSEGSTADSALSSRRKAMRDSVSGLSNGAQLCVDFYDRTRLATWVRTHDGLIPWVRALVGRTLRGWQSYGPWAPGGENTPYLVDDTLRLRQSGSEADKGLPAVSAIDQLRKKVREPRHVVRLVGLSGVGKTRLVQALFEQQIGHESLNPTLAVYANMADSPDPQPVALANDLIARRARIILIVDNCPSDLHYRLSEVCRQSHSLLSLLTIEYDIQDDTPEGTEVFKLEPSSPELIKSLIRRRFRTLSEVDAGTIAEFSGGNARIAIALASTVNQHETLAGFTDEQLFQRLFRQSQAPSEKLYLDSQVCALVYSVEGKDTGGTSELALLGTLIGRTPQELYRSMAELLRRDLAQARSEWRAILPQAIANRLAAVALQDIPYEEIESQLLKDKSLRLLRSFSRRLGYLHKSKEAVRIVKKWLTEGGLLGNVNALSDIEHAMLRNVAPVAPEETLVALERAATRDNGSDAIPQCREHCSLIRALAYEPALFDRSIELLVTLETAAPVDTKARGVEILVSLFHVILSGTHATIEQRAAHIRALLTSADERRRALGILALRAILTTRHITPAADFDFGARSRDYGFWPANKDEVHHWFNFALNLAEAFACELSPTGADARRVLADKFDELWVGSENREEVTRIAGKVHSLQPWPEGWLAIRQTLNIHAKGLPEESLSALLALEKELRPSDLVQRVRMVMRLEHHLDFDLDDFEETTDDAGARWAKSEQIIRELGQTLASDGAARNELLSELITSNANLWPFGEGLAAQAEDPEQLWRELVDAFTNADPTARRGHLLRGFLSTLRIIEPVLTGKLLEDAVEHDTLGAWFPFLQTAVDLQESDVKRLRRALAAGKAPASMYTHLQYGRATARVPPSDMRDILITVAALADGYDVALDVLYMRLHNEVQRDAKISPEVMEAGCQLLTRMEFAGKNDRADHRIGDIARMCLSNTEGAAITAELCGRLKGAVVAFETNALYHDDLLAGLFEVQPTAALDGLCAGSPDEFKTGIRILRNGLLRRQPMALVSDDHVLSWCDRDPQSRYTGLAYVIPIYNGPENAPPTWTSIALKFLLKAPGPDAILRQFTARFTTTGGMAGTFGTHLESMVTLLDQLEGYPALQATIAEQKQALSKWIESEKQRDRSRQEDQDERFE